MEQGSKCDEVNALVGGWRVYEKKGLVCLRTRYDAISRQTLMGGGYGRPGCNSVLGCCAALSIGTSAQLVSSFGSLIFRVLLPVWGDIRIGSHA